MGFSFYAGSFAADALIAQLAEHIHGKDEVISSILIEGCGKNPSDFCLGVLRSKTPYFGWKGGFSLTGIDYI